MKQSMKIPKINLPELMPKKRAKAKVIEEKPLNEWEKNCTNCKEFWECILLDINGKCLCGWKPGVQIETELERQIKMGPN